MKWLLIVPLALAALSGAAYADKVTQSNHVPTASHVPPEAANNPDGIWRPRRPFTPNNVFRGSNGGQHGVAGGSKHH